jgi:hypothetical protein
MSIIFECFSFKRIWCELRLIYDWLKDEKEIAKYKKLINSNIMINNNAENILIYYTVYTLVN